MESLQGQITELEKGHITAIKLVMTVKHKRMKTLPGNQGP